MERLGVSYSPLYPLQMILHLYMYKQFYMLTVDFNSKEETSNLETSAPAWRFTSHWLQISRIAGQVRKIENPETLPQERF